MTPPSEKFQRDRLFYHDPVLYQLLVGHSAHHHLAPSTMRCTEKIIRR